ncbi:L-cystine transport system permease protein [Butyrivibrio sp. ob235]|uniref:ABC transporter permease subunit n=1 Tax=Butyrivibrio sp. ob235 TaxID=1761780 RepID=UPI0008AACFA4|nr:ABC transporter permease subunit [Butyrivibrio sp. ob235]SEL03905.1 L-cystine transport system permease protein [Butyrivibrio sp. ob235]
MAFHFNFRTFIEIFLYAVQYLPVTLILAYVPSIIDFVFGTWLAFGEYCGHKGCKFLRNFMTLFSKCMPMLLLLFLGYFITYNFLAWLRQNYNFPIGPKDMDPIWVAIFVLSMDGIGYFAQTMKGALNSIGKDQLEAGYSIGLTTKQTFLRIVLPQIIIEAFPNLKINVRTRIMLSALVFTIAIIDVMNAATSYAENTASFIEAYLVCAVIYWGICTGTSKLLSLIEKRIAIKTGVLSRI